jgi:hypothetical protein
LPGTAFHALFILQSLQANMSVSKSNSHHSSNRRSVTLHMPARRAPPHSFLLSIRKLPDFCLARLHTNQPDTRDGPHLNHGDVSSPSKPLSIACEFLNPVSYRSLGTLSFIVSWPHFRSQSPMRCLLRVCTIWYLGRWQPPITICRLSFPSSGPVAPLGCEIPTANRLAGWKRTHLGGDNSRNETNREGDSSQRPFFWGKAKGNCSWEPFWEGAFFVRHLDQSNVITLSLSKTHRYLRTSPS